jgi:hypothetical protein
MPKKIQCVSASFSLATQNAGVSAYQPKTKLRDWSKIIRRYGDAGGVTSET